MPDLYLGVLWLIPVGLLAILTEFFCVYPHSPKKSKESSPINPYFHTYSMFCPSHSTVYNPAV
jgi:hypothetical protein